MFSIHEGEVLLLGWREAMKQAWGAVPARDLLTLTSPAWAEMKLMPPDPAEAVSLGVVGRSLKYGQSMCIALPLLNGDAITRLMVYLHRIRLDALQGGIRAPWLNPGNVEKNPDIVLITPPRAGLQELSRVQALHARILRPGHQSRTKIWSDSETLIVDGAGDLMELTDLISSESRPFVLVADGTRGGNDGVWGIDSALSECFPETPRIVLLSLGDGQAVAKMRQGRTRTHLWVMRLEDKVGLTADNNHPSALQIGVISDETANGTLGNLATRLFALQRELEKAKDPVLKERLAVVGKVFRALNELSVPLPRLEDTLRKATRPGLYPIRCLDRWLEVAGQDCCQYGETENASRYLMNEVRQFYSLLMQGLSGKAAWLKEHLRASRIKSSSVLVLCGNPHEANALEQWLDDELDPGWTETIQVAAMDGVKGYREQRRRTDEVVIVGMLWPSRQHWLATPCRRLTIPAYPYEAAQIERQLQRWWPENGASSSPKGDKLGIWLLDWAGERRTDKDTIAKSAEVETVKFANRSEYPLKHIHARVPIAKDLNDWLDVLLEEPAEPTIKTAHGEVLNRDLVWITTQGHDASLPWAKTRPVLVLKNAEICPTLPEFLTEGDQIVLLKECEERLATQERLFEMVSETEGMQQLLRVADRWQTLVDAVAKRFKPHQLQPYLKKERIEIGDAAIANWFRHKVYGPRDRAAVLIFARLADVNQPEKTATYIANAIDKVRSMHQHLGQQLRKALIERGRGANTITIGTLELDGRTFDDMLEMATVESVKIPDTVIVASTREESLSQVVGSVQAQFPGRLHFTVPALKSVRDSVYKDVAKFRACLTLMATLLYENYQKQGRMHEVLEHFAQEHIEFKPTMSDVTMGQFFDNRKYKHRTADLNRHFCLGNARDATRTLRIHFEWDDEDKQIVVHHAGRHLETTQS